MNKNKLKIIPKFTNEDEERKFWASHDATDYFDDSMQVELDLSELKPTTRPVTVRLPSTMINDLKKIANKKDVPYQSLLKIMLADQIKRENKGNCR